MSTLQHVFYRTLTCRTGELRIAHTKRILMLWVLLGVGMGTALSCYDAAAADTLWLDHGLAVADTAQNLWDVFAPCLFPTILLMALILLCGFCAIGQPAALFLLLSHGCAVGIAAADCFLCHGFLQGLVRAAAMIVPHGFFSSLLLLLAARDAMELSGRLFAYLVHGDTEPDIRSRTRRYFLHFLGRTALLPLGAAAQTLFVWLFAAFS